MRIGLKSSNTAKTPFPFVDKMESLRADFHRSRAQLETERERLQEAGRTPFPSVGLLAAAMSDLLAIYSDMDAAIGQRDAEAFLQHSERYHAAAQVFSDAACAYAAEWEAPLLPVASAQ